MLIGAQVKELFLCAQLLGLDDLRFLGHQGNDAHGGKPGAFFHGIVVRHGGNGDVTNGIDPAQQLGVHPEHTSAVGKEQHFSLGRLRIVGAFHLGHGCHPSCAVILVELSGIFFPDKHGAFANVQHMLDILFPDDMAPFEGNAFEAVVHLRNIMAQRHAYSVFYIDFLHRCYLVSISPAEAAGLAAGC